MKFAFNDEKKAENGNYFTLPNVMFQLGLSTGELATYAYLLAVRIVKPISVSRVTKQSDRPSARQGTP